MDHHRKCALSLYWDGAAHYCSCPPGWPRKERTPVSQNYINHVALVLDASGSMHTREKAVVKVADAHVKSLADLSTKMDQETRATTYTFSYTKDIACVYYDKDVLRMPSLAGRYHTGGQTALLDATAKAINDLKITATLYGDHAFLVYVITDGQENDSQNNSPSQFKELLRSLPDNWTVACFVPDLRAEQEARKYGFPAGNIAIWDSTSEEGLEYVAKTIHQSTQSYMTSRASGVRGMTNLFEMGQSQVQAAVPLLQTLHTGKFDIFQVRLRADGKRWAVKEYVTNAMMTPWRTGMLYYKLTKVETVQPNKKIVIMDKRTGEYFTGADARAALGMQAGYVKVYPRNLTQYDVYVQSTSTNRKLVPGTSVLVMR